MFKTVRSVFVCACAALLLVSVIATVGAVKLGVDFPSRLHIGDAKSTLEGRSYAKLEMPTAGKLLDGKFQSGFESYVADHVPMRDSVLLADASLERQGISAAAALFGYGVYPTYYGSNYVAVPEDGLVAERPAPAPKSTANLERYIAMLNAFAAAHPDAGMAVRLVTEPRHTHANPAYGLMGGDGLIDEEWVQANMVARLDPALDAQVDGTPDYETLKRTWFKTDVHCKVQRTLESYNSIAGTLGLKRFEWDEHEAVLAKAAWYGAAARSARDYDYSDELVDLDIDFENLAFYSLDAGPSGERVSTGSREKFLRGEVSSGKLPKTGLHGSYFGEKGYDIYNEGDNNGKTCLVVGDSFMRAMYRYIADNYAHTVVVFPGNHAVDSTLEGLFGKYGADDLVVVMHCQKYESIASVSPGFMDLG